MTGIEDRLDIIIPAHNEASRIAPTLIEYCSYFRDRATIIVVANGCTDGTVSIVRELQSRFSNLALLDVPARIGKGGAVRAGFKVGRGAYVGFVDADLSTTPEEYARLAAICHDRGFVGVIGSRWMRASVVMPRQPAERRVASRVFNLLVRCMLRIKYADTQCGAKVFKRSAISAVLDNLALSNFAFDIDLLHALNRHGHSVAEVPTVWSDVAAGTKVQLVSTAFAMFRALLWLALRDSYVARLPYFEFLARDAILRVCGAIRLLVASDIPPYADSACGRLQGILERLQDAGHSVTWVCSTTLPHAARWRRSAGWLKLFAWWCLSDRDFDGILEVAGQSRLTFPHISSKPKFVIGALPDDPRYREYFRIDEIDGKFVVRRPNGRVMTQDLDLASALLRALRSALGSRGTFHTTGEDWSLTFTEVVTGQTREQALSI